MPHANLYSVRDTEAEQIIGAPMLLTRHAVAVRNFTELLQNKDIITGQYPHHFELLWIGRLDTETGELTPPDDGKPIVLYTGKDWKLDTDLRLTVE